MYGKKIKKIFKFFFKNKKRGFLVILGLIVLLAIGGNLYKKITADIEDSLEIYQTDLKTLRKTVSESGVVKIAEEIKLSFKNSGRIDQVYVAVGDKVEAGKILAKTETSDLAIQLQKANASLQSAQAQLDKALAGATQQAIDLAKAQVQSAEVNLKNKQEALVNAELAAQQNLDNAYEDALETLNDIHLVLANVFFDVDLIQRTYFNGNDQESLTVKEAKENIVVAHNNAKTALDLALMDATAHLNIDNALTTAKKSLDSAYGDLSRIRDMTEKANYRTVVLSADKTTLDTHKSTLNTARTSIVSAQQTISSAKITNQTNIDNAKALVRTAERSLAEAKISLEKTLTGPTAEEIKIHEALVAQAHAERAAINNQINQSYLKSPVNSQVVKIAKRVGETVVPGETVISVLPDKPFQVEVDIYEEDIPQIKLGDTAEISLIAFPDQIIKGKVVLIDPIEKIINSVVYYKVAIGFDEHIDGLKPGMTADITIITEEKQNILAIPVSAIQKKNGEIFVNVLSGKETEKRVVRVGLRGDDSLVEVLDGLKQGEKIIIP